MELKIAILLIVISVSNVLATPSYSQVAKVSLEMKNTSLEQVMDEIERQTEFYFIFNQKQIDVNRVVDIQVENKLITDILPELFKGTDVNFAVFDRKILLTTDPIENSLLAIASGTEPQQKQITGTVTDEKGSPLPGVSVSVKGTTVGITTGIDGKFILSIPANATTLVFSFIGMQTQEVAIGTGNVYDVVLTERNLILDEVIVVGYGTMKKSDLTGAVSRTDITTFKNQPNVSIVQSLQGSSAGLNVGQIVQAGQEPTISIRGRTSISGVQNPLIVLDGVIFRGNLIDINPNDIEAIDLLKDNSAAAVYGSQAANGVIIITTSKSARVKGMKPLINYSASYSFQSPRFELIPGNGADFIKKNTEIDIYNSRTASSGYLEPNPAYTVTGRFKTNAQRENYLAGREANWYDLVTNDNMYTINQNLSLSSQTDYMNYFISAGYTDEKGYMVNENYKRYNARINVDSHVTDWLTVGVQSFASISDYSGLNLSTNYRYIMPYETAYDADGKLYTTLSGSGSGTNPLVIAEADNLDIRNNVFGNIYANIDIPFIEGLSYKINFYNNYSSTRFYSFQPYQNNFQGQGDKDYSNSHDMSSDNILTYKRVFNDIHNLNITLVYGFEKRESNYTNASASVFTNDLLGYNSLQSGSSALQTTNSGAWEEASLYNMARLFYSFQDKYMITGTIRRDGFSGFSENNKFGLFPSVALGWVATKEPFFQNINIVNNLKFRLSYGSSGNRTVGRYQTLARTSGGFNYVNESGSSVYTQAISSLASPNLKWETTTGLNLGIDFGLFKSRLSGSIEYYNNNTKNLLYNVDIPSIGRFNKFPDNLGKIHNHGIEISVSSVNVKANNFTWTSDFAFSRNRNELKKLLGFDNNGDGKEDDLVSENLFIGQPLSVIYQYAITGQHYQLGDVIPAGADLGSWIIVDQNKDGKIDQANDRVIIGYTDPSYRFSITNQFRYKNWSLNIFINSVQGGKHYYYSPNDLFLEQFEHGFNNISTDQQYEFNFPLGLDYWLPERPNARYQRIDMHMTAAMLAVKWIQRNFIRLQDVSLDYNFNFKFLKKIDVNSLKLFVSGKNLFTLTKWPGWDPESDVERGVTQDGRPVLKSYTFGLNIEF